MSIEPVYLELEPARLTEYGKRWMNTRLEDIERFRDVLQDICNLAAHEIPEGLEIARELDAAGCPTALTGMAQYSMAKVGDMCVGHGSQWTLPAVIGLSLLTTAPTTASTGTTVAGTVAAYTGYAILTPTVGTWTNAATSATPSVVTNNGAITWGACTASTSTLLGFCISDSATISGSNLLWVASVTSTVISTTQTPPTIASAAMSLSITGS
jgi:hypothetical protein